MIACLLEFRIVLRNKSFLCNVSSLISKLFVSSRTWFKMKLLPNPDAPHKNTFLPSSMYFFRSETSFSWSEIFTFFFCLCIVTKASMSDESENENGESDLATQALDIIMENNTLQKRVIDPLKRKLFPYLMCITVFNLALFLMVAYLVNRLSVIL